MKQLTENVFSVGAINWDRRLFDEIIPLPDGTSYNAYLIKGSEKTALLDTVDFHKKDGLIENLLKLGIEKIDYLVSHHAEQDHSASISDVLSIFPDAEVVTNPKCKAMLIDLLEISDAQFIEVEDGQELSLGDKTLKFIYTPWVHWPETFSTYLQEDKILFSCDFFGSHLATSSLFVENNSDVYEPAKRYYAEIMMPFRKPIQKNLEKIDPLQIDMIAPSHGPVYHDPDFIINAYKDWVSDNVTNEVVIPYVSMHGSTQKMVEYLVDALSERYIKVHQFNLTVTDLGTLATTFVDAATIVLGSPTFLVGPHPVAAQAAILLNALRPKTKFLSIIGSYGWGGKMVQQIQNLTPSIKAEILEPVISKGHPAEEDFRALDKLADNIAAKHKELEIFD